MTNLLKAPAVTAERLAQIRGVLQKKCTETPEISARTADTGVIPRLGTGVFPSYYHARFTVVETSTGPQLGLRWMLNGKRFPRLLHPTRKMPEAVTQGLTLIGDTVPSTLYLRRGSEFLPPQFALYSVGATGEVSSQLYMKTEILFGRHVALPAAELPYIELLEQLRAGSLGLRAICAQPVVADELIQGNLVAESDILYAGALSVLLSERAPLASSEPYVKMRVDTAVLTSTAISFDDYGFLQILPETVRDLREERTIAPLREMTPQWLENYQRDLTTSVDILSDPGAWHPAVRASADVQTLIADDAVLPLHHTLRGLSAAVKTRDAQQMLRHGIAVADAHEDLKPLVRFFPELALSVDRTGQLVRFVQDRLSA